MTEDGYMGFVGVSTSASSIMRIFPAWADELDLPTRRIVGHDLPPNAPAQAYRELITAIRSDPQHFGGLVTTHKVNVYESCRDLFDELDERARLFGEVSSIAKRGSRLTGAAKDPITVRLALEEIVDDDHFGRTGGHVLCLGSGGSGMALTHELGVRRDRPAKVICTGRRQVKLDEVRALHERAGLDLSIFEYVLCREPADSDRLVAALPPASLVVNSTGMGKDMPGSPLSDGVRFPDRSIVWDFNYRGTLELLEQARAQARAQAGSDPDAALRVVDGWRYFVHGWTQVVADVFDIAMPPERVDLLGKIAARCR